MTTFTSATPGRLLAGLAARRSARRRGRVLDRIVFAVVGLLALIVVVGPYLALHDPYRSRPVDRLLSPSAGHWLGTDEAGRDILSRLLVGARPTLLSSIVTVVVAALIGVLVASVAAASGRWVDEILMRICDIALGLPGIVLALGIAIALGPSLTSAVVAMTIAIWPSFARLTRGVMRQTMTSAYVEAARCMGASRWRVMTRHVLPNSLDVVIVQGAFDIGGMTLLLAALSYVGAGAQPPSAEWGAMASDGAGYVVTAWWAALFPGLAITLAAVAFGLLGDILQVRRDPSLRAN